MAELTSAFVGSQLNLPADITDHASSIDHWLEKLKRDKRFIFKAAAQAQLARDWIMNLHPDYAAAQPTGSEGSAEPTNQAPEPV